MPDALTDAQWEELSDDGFTVVPGVFSGEVLGELLASMARDVKK
jgi:hypothetical protein